ncbi:MAG: hypothetical protein K2G21_02670 [Muribaculaceae bacterium]|nr:hypothetical protein [Muribaculaceae bacterium]
MKHIYITFIMLGCLLLNACDGRTGYFDDEQKDTLALLTRGEWALYEQIRDDQTTTFDKVGLVYRFTADGKGWRRWYDTETGKPTATENFQWTFTNGSFAVLYIASKIERYWLIERLNDSRLWVCDGIRDPVIYPSTDNYHLHFKSL